MITDNFLWETMELPYVITEKPGNYYWIYIRGGGDHMCVFWEAVNNNKESIVAMAGGQFHNQVDRYDLPLVIWDAVG